MSVLFLPPSAGAASIPDATETTAGKIRIATSAEATAGTNDLTSMTPLKVKSVVDAAIVGGVTYQGTFDASSPADLSNATKGDLYIISVAGSYQGQDWAVGDHLLINADMGGTLDPNKIDKVDNTDSVTSVAGRTGAVVLSAGDVSGLATVATSGAYSDLSGTPSLATVATTGAYSDLTGTPTLGTAAAEDVGTSAGNVVQLNGSAQLPAVDGSLLTNISATVAALNDVGDVSAAAPSNGDVIKYNSTSGDWENGAVAYADVSGTPTLATVATTGAYSDLTGTPTLGTAAALDVGTSASNVVQLNGSAQLPAVDGSLLTGITASVAALDDVGDVNITSVQDYAVLKYDSGTSEWIDAPQINYVYTSTTQSLDLKPGVNRVTMAGASSITLTLGIPTLVASQGAVFSVLSTGSATNTLTIGSTSWNFDQHQGGMFVATGLNTAYMVSTIDYNQLENLPTLGTAAAEDVGTSAGNVVQLNGSAQLPAVDGSLLTGITATVAALNDVGDVNAPTPANTNVIKYNSTSGDWESGAVAYSEVTGTPTLATVATTGAYSDLTGAPDVPVLENNYVTSTSTATAISEDGHYTYWLGNGNTGLITLTLPAQSGGVVAYLTFTNQDSSADHVVSLSSGQFRLSGGVSATSLSIPAGSTRSFYYYSVSYWELSSNELNELGDVTITTPANGEALIYNSTSGDWENGTVSATVAALNDIGDVSAAAPNNGDVIAYNSTSGDWEATAQSGGGGSAPSVTVSSPSTDQTLSAPSGIEEAYIYTPSTNITVNLVAAATCGSGFKYQIKNRSTNTITIDPNGSETIDGSATFDISTQEASLTLITDGSNWFII